MSIAHPDIPALPERDARVATIGVLHVINGEHYAGAERVQDLLALRLPEFGFEVGFACVKPGRFGEMRQSVDAPLYQVPMRSKFDLRAAGRIARIVRRGGYKLVHGHTVRTALVGRLAAALAGVSFVYHVHSPTSRNTTRPWLNRVNTIVERLSLTGVSRLIAVSESLGRHVRAQGFKPERIAVVHNGVPAIAHWEGDGPDLRGHRAQHGRENGTVPLPAEGDSPVFSDTRTGTVPTWTLGTVALFRPRKGVEVLLESLALLKQQGLLVKLRAVGTFETPDYSQQIAALAAKLGVAEQIDWLGFTRDVTGELLEMDLFVLPSLFGEGLPMVVLEAMAAGVPVVATDVEGIPEAIRDGQDGLIARAGDAADLARAIARVVRREVDWSALRHSAIARHAEHFSDRAMAAGVAAVYRDVLST
jgi:glycosyltransferase involved in cell wall biosynthesis